MKKFRQLSEELTPSSKPEPGRESVGGRFSSGAPKGATKPAPLVTSEAKEAGDDPTGDTPSPNLGLKKGKTVASGSVTEATSAAVRMQRALEKIRQSREDSEKRAKELLKPTPKNEEVKDEYARKIDKYLKKKYNKEEVEIEELLKPTPKNEDADPCWKGYKMVGMKNKNGRQVPNCVPGEGVPAMKKEEIVQEGRPSQRHPLEGHEYHKKSDEALVHIAKDAHAAAEAMKGHNTTAENKYRDQANDSATVRHFRKTSGMPDWYKKKYGHMKEEMECNQSKAGVKCTVHGMKDCTPGEVKEAFKPMDEPNFNLSIQARQKKADENKNTSTVKNIAKQAMKKQVTKMSVKESLEESRKAEIVKDILKKGKKTNDSKFEPEPVLGTTVVKADN